VTPTSRRRRDGTGTRSKALGLPFTRWSVRKLAEARADVAGQTTCLINEGMNVSVDTRSHASGHSQDLMDHHAAHA
jgi:hypothetical protein